MLCVQGLKKLKKLSLSALHIGASPLCDELETIKLYL